MACRQTIFRRNYLSAAERAAVEARAARLPVVEADAMVSTAYDNPPEARRRGWTVPPVESTQEVAA